MWSVVEAIITQVDVSYFSKCVMPLTCIRGDFCDGFVEYLEEEE